MIESQLTGTGASVPAARPHVVTRRAVGGWILYDLANTIFSMGVISLFFSLWVRDQVGATRADATYSIITAVSMAIIFVASPVLGAMTDRAPRRMPFLVVSTIICCVFTALLGRLGFWTTAVCFVIANIAYQAGLQFYDALLPEVSTEANRGKIGGIGVGIGYLGSYLAVGLGLSLGSDNKPLLFGIIALLFFLFALPCFFWVRERGNPHPQPITLQAAGESIRQTVATLRSGERYPGLLRFLIGRVFYTDSINTVISIMALYTVNIAMANGIPAEDAQRSAQLILLFAITFAVIGGFVWGWLADRLGPKRTLNYVLIGWMAIFVGAAAVGILGLPLEVFYVVAAAAGLCLGGVWAADRPFILRLTPPARIGEFYGLYGMVGRFSSITGPIIWASVTYLTITRGGLEPRIGQGIGVIVLLSLIVIAYAILRPVSDAPRRWSEEEQVSG